MSPPDSALNAAQLLYAACQHAPDPPRHDLNTRFFSEAEREREWREGLVLHRSAVRRTAALANRRHVRAMRIDRAAQRAAALWIRRRERVEDAGGEP